MRIARIAVIAVLLLGLAGASAAENGTLKGYMFGDYYWVVSADDAAKAPEKQNAFQFRRVYFTYDKGIAEDCRPILGDEDWLVVGVRGHVYEIAFGQDHRRPRHGRAAARRAEGRRGDRAIGATPCPPSRGYRLATGAARSRFPVFRSDLSCLGAGRLRPLRARRPGASRTGPASRHRRDDRS